MGLLELAVRDKKIAGDGGVRSGGIVYPGVA